MDTKHFSSIGEILRHLRIKNKLPLRKVAAFLDIDQSFLSKIERGERIATKEQVIKLAEIFNVEKKELIIKYLSDKIVYHLTNEVFAMEALREAEKKIYNGKK